MANVEDAIKSAKDRIPDFTPTPPEFHSQATAYELKSRLQWGEPGLTIVDVRPHDAFNECRILGAINLPMDRLPQMAETTLLPRRDIYVYGANEQETTAGVNAIREAGSSRVAELKGGLDAWREISGPLEGTATNTPPSPGAYSLGARLQEFAQEKAKEKRMQ